MMNALIPKRSSSFAAAFSLCLVAAPLPSHGWSAPAETALAETSRAVSAQSSSGIRLRVRFSPPPGSAPASGRLVIAFIGPGSKLPPGTSPEEAPFWDDLQPIFAKDVTSLNPGDAVELDDTWEHNGVPLAKLSAGRYQAAARLITTRTSSSWKSAAGNWTGPTVSFGLPEAVAATAEPSAPVELELSEATKEKAWRQTQGAELFEIKSELLSAALGREITLRAGVVVPIGYDSKAQGSANALRYAAVYEVPGFGGDHHDAGTVARSRRALSRTSEGASSSDPARELAENTFWIVLDPESNNGHTLFADSANNGPRARALIEELIPALEKKYPLVPRPEARLLRGHSSGGWSTLWLALNHPETFGAAWPSSPDPVDFRRFQAVDLYTQKNMFIVPADDTPAERAAAERIRVIPGGASEAEPGRWLITSYRKAGKGTMSVRQETQGENMLGADNTSGQQWDSWCAVFGPKNSRGNPAALFDPVSGTIDPAVAEQFRTYDIGHKLRTDPVRYGPIFRKNIHLIVGDADEFSLNEAVALLRADLDAVWPAEKTPGTGYLTIIPRATHGSVGKTREAQAIAGQMLDRLRAAGMLVKP